MEAALPPDQTPPAPISQVCSEPNPVLTAPDDAEMPLPSNPQTVFLGGIFALGIFAALYAASSIILPVVLAFVLNLLLRPAVHLLQRVLLPRPIGAILAIVVVIGTLTGLMAVLSVPASDWARKLPDGIPRLETHLMALKGPIERSKVSFNGLSRSQLIQERRKLRFITISA